MLTHGLPPDVPITKPASTEQSDMENAFSCVLLVFAMQPTNDQAASRRSLVGITYNQAVLS